MRMNKMASRREFLEALPTSRLDEMLQNELQKETVDADLVRLVLCVLEERETGYPLETNDEISAALEDFEKSLDKRPGRPAKTKVSWILKAASILLVIGLLLFAVPRAVNAESFFEMLARWTDSIFEFFNPSDTNDDIQPEYVFETEHPGLQQIYDAVQEIGVTDPVVPMWVPNEYELEDIKILREPTEVSMVATMSYNERRLIITVVARSEGAYFDHEKDVQDVGVFEIAGVEHYIMTNNKKANAAWIVNNVECSIVADCQEDIYKILRSVYTMED